MFLPTFYKCFQGSFSKIGAALPPAIQKLVGWWKLSPSSGEMQDSYKVPGDFPIELKQSLCGQFDGVGDSIELTHTAGVNTITSPSNWKVSFIVDAITGSDQDILGRRNVDGFKIMATTGELRAYVGFRNVSLGVVTPGVAYTAEIVSDGVNFYGYLDGVEMGTKAVGTTDRTSDPIGIGYNPGSGGSFPVNYFGGRIWDVEFNNNKYRLDEGEGSQAYDTGTGGNHADITSSNITTFRSGRQDVTHHLPEKGFSVGYENLVRNSEDISASTYGGNYFTILSEEEIRFDAIAGYFRNADPIPVTTGVDYVFEWEVQNVDVTQFQYRVWDINNASQIVVGDYTSSVNSSNFTKISVPFTVPAGCSSVYVYPLYQTTTSVRSCLLRKIQLRKASALATYCKTFSQPLTEGVYVPSITGVTDILGNTATNPSGSWNGAPNKYQVKPHSVTTYSSASPSKITLTTPVVLSGDFYITFRANFTGTSTGCVIGYADGSGVQDAILYDTASGCIKVKIRDNNYYFTSVLNTGRFINVTRVGTTLSVSSEDFYQEITGVVTDDYTIEDIGVVNIFAPFQGTISDLDINGAKARLNEGSGTSISYDDGTPLGTVTSPDINAFWANEKVPALVSYADRNWGFFMNTTTEAPTQWLQSDLDFSVTGLNQYFFSSGVGKGLLAYNSVLTGSELTDVTDFMA